MVDVPPTVFMAHDVPTSIFNGASSFEDIGEEVGVLPRSRPGLNDQQKKDLMFCHLGRDVRRELACQPPQRNTEELNWIEFYFTKAYHHLELSSEESDDGPSMAANAAQHAPPATQRTVLMEQIVEQMRVMSERLGRLEGTQKAKRHELSSVPTTSSTEKCILGMNILRHLAGVGIGPSPSPESPSSSIPRLARTLNSPTLMPPRSTQLVTVTDTNPSVASDVLVKPLNRLDNNLVSVYCGP
ncbi:hypothetical protein ElyMa_005706600 [Elysia marginata]|uniref:Uncharacterized protein n=1 Tax=Elysia marginata TaxID=1093978 RepID=A0AAV4FIH8_9GAST|nr:hypothetical protein ElyMa_005706600 [Elysia marginata]